MRLASPLRVNTGTLIQVAAMLRLDTGDDRELVAALAQLRSSPGITDGGWMCVAAANEAAAAAQSWVRAAAGQTADLAAALARAVDGYAAADERAAVRAMRTRGRPWGVSW